MGDKRRVLIAEDHDIVRSGLRHILAGQPDLEVIGEAKNGRDAVRLAGALDPDLVLMDLHMPDTNGIDAIAEIRSRSKVVRILVLTFLKSEEHVRASLRAGADGYALKDDSTEEILGAIRKVFAGKTYLSPSVMEQVAYSIFSDQRKSKSEMPKSHWDLLTVREREILKLISEGHTSRYIASRLYRSVKTVDKHRANLMRKLNLHNVAALTQFAIQHGLTGTGLSGGLPT